MRKLATIAAVPAAALALTAGAWAGYGYGTTTTSTTATTTSTVSGKSGTHVFRAALTAAQETPRAKAPKGAGGAFTARTTATKSERVFTWKLTFHGLSGKAVAAHVHIGKKGSPGPVAIPLCGPCRSGQSGRVTIASSAEDAMERGGAYVNVHTAKNPNGEIRGQIAVVHA